MRKIFIASLLFSGIGLSLFARKTELKHTIKKGETLYSISRNYGVKVNELVRANPVLKSNSHIKPGQQINIPGVSAPQAPQNVRHEEIKKVTPVPSTPETAYKEEDNRNRILSTASASVNNDQPVIVKPAIENASFPLRTSSNNAGEYESIFGQYGDHGYKVKRNRGAANYLAENTSGNPYLALYNDAETGSVIKVTNLMNKKSVYVKVVGKVPPADASNEVIIKLGNKSAQELGARDEKFLVEVSGYCSN